MVSPVVPFADPLSCVLLPRGMIGPWFHFGEALMQHNQGAPLLRPAHGAHTGGGRGPERGRPRDGAARSIRTGRVLTKRFGAPTT
eukprot:COSAG01_NODE_4337_length_5123_cov_21.379180_1_plen_85_part_00